MYGRVEGGVQKMTKLERYWMSNRSWIRFTSNGPVVRDDAPEEAKASYQKYLEQVKEKEKTI